MSKFIIASEENLDHLAHYGVKGMKWRERKAIENTRGMTKALEKGTVKGRDGSLKADEIELEKKKKEILGKIIIGSGKLMYGAYKKGKEAAKATGKALTKYGEAKAAPYKTMNAIGAAANGGEQGAKGFLTQLLKNKKKK